MQRQHSATIFFEHPIRRGPIYALWFFLAVGKVEGQEGKYVVNDGDQVEAQQCSVRGCSDRLCKQAGEFFANDRAQVDRRHVEAVEGALEAVGDQVCRANDKGHEANVPEEAADDAASYEVETSVNVEEANPKEHVRC